MKRIFSLFLFLAFILLNGDLAFGQRTVGGTRLDLDDNAGNHIFLTTLGSSFGMNTTGLAPNIGALLDLNSTTKGLLLPRMTAAQEAGVSAIAGMTVYNSTAHTIDFYNGSIWSDVNGGWSLAGNSGTNSAVNYLGTNDGQDLVFRTSSIERMRIFSTGNISLVSSPGIAVNISGPAATSINANGAIQTTGDVILGGAALQAPGGEERLRIIQGTVVSTGAINAGAGFAINHTGAGQYTITYTNAFALTPALALSAGTGGVGAVIINFLFDGTNNANIEIRSLAGVLTDHDWTFIAIGSR